MIEIKIMPMLYNLRCDIGGCGEIAKHAIGNPDAPKSTRFNLCDSCLEKLKKELYPKTTKNKG